MDGHLHFVDCGDRLIVPGGGAIRADLMQDALHPNAAGEDLSGVQAASWLGSKIWWWHSSKQGCTAGARCKCGSLSASSNLINCCPAGMELLAQCLDPLSKQRENDCCGPYRLQHDAPCIQSLTSRLCSALNVRHSKAYCSHCNPCTSLLSVAVTKLMQRPAVLTASTRMIE